MTRISSYLSRQCPPIAEKLSDFFPPALIAANRRSFQWFKLKVFGLLAKIADIAKRWIGKEQAKKSDSEGSLSPFCNLPSEIQSRIYRHLDSHRDRYHVARACRLTRENVAFADREVCYELQGLIRVCTECEPQLIDVFPHLHCCVHLTLDDQKDLYKLSQISLNLRQALRTIALHWGYCQPEILEKILEKLGYVRSDVKTCEEKFEILDTQWQYGPLIPQLLDRAITSSCVPSLKLLLAFIPKSKKRGRDGNLSSSLAANTPHAPGGRTNLNMAIFCLVRRELYSWAEQRRFAAMYGGNVAKTLAQISPAFDGAAVKGLQTCESDESIWELMRCGDNRQDITNAALNIYQTMAKNVEICFPVSPNHCSTLDQVDSKQLCHIPLALWGRQLISHSKPFKMTSGSDSDQINIEHRTQLDLAKCTFERTYQQSLHGNDLPCVGTNVESEILGAFGEMTQYRPVGSKAHRNRYFRRSLNLIQALQISLYGYTHQAIALRDAVKNFLYATAKCGAKFPQRKLDMLFNPLQQRNHQQLADQMLQVSDSGRFCPDFLIYQWLLTAVVSKLFGRQLYICSTVSCSNGIAPSCDEIELLVELAILEFRKYDLWDLKMVHNILGQKSDKSLIISASFHPSETRHSKAHSLIAIHNDAMAERYFIPVQFSKRGKHAISAN